MPRVPPRSLYLDPKETHSSTIRNLPFAEMYNAAVKAHTDTFKRFPPKNIVGLQRGTTGTRR
jgi:hypothetical protein